MYTFLWLALILFFSTLVFPKTPIANIAWCCLFVFIISHYFNLSNHASLALSCVLLTSYYLYHYYNDYNNRKSTHTHTNLLGSHFTLSNPIISGKGTANIHARPWVLHGPDLPVGSIVTVTAVIDGILVVAAHQR